jgi:hypothetical protein
MAALTKNMRDLARIIAVVEPVGFGILARRGVIETSDLNGKIQYFQFVFKVPTGLYSPISLRELLLTDRLHPLEYYIRLAK